jgi:hypothetical protein
MEIAAKIQLTHKTRAACLLLNYLANFTEKLVLLIAASDTTDVKLRFSSRYNLKIADDDARMQRIRLTIALLCLAVVPSCLRPMGK